VTVTPDATTPLSQGLPERLPERLHAAGEALADIGHRLYARGWLPASSGNLSLRLGGECCAVTVSGCDKGRLGPADVMAVDLAGRAITPGRPSAETALHTALYRRDAAIAAVLHVHAPNAVAWTRRHPDLETLTLRGYELQKAFAGVTTHTAHTAVPVLDNDQDVDALARAVERRLDALDSGPVWTYLIRDHGLYAWGADLAAAERHLEALDHLLAVELAVGQVAAAAPAGRPL